MSRFLPYYQSALSHIARHCPGTNTSGSVFTARELNTPKKVAAFAYERIFRLYNMDLNRRQIFPITCDFFVGVDSLVAISQLPGGTSIVTEMRERKQQPGVIRAPSYNVRIAYGIAPSQTRDLVIIAGPIPKQSGTHTFETVYPGKYAPDFDDKRFWREHVFVRAEKYKR